jgi:hypothetical protein
MKEPISKEGQKAVSILEGAIGQAFLLPRFANGRGGPGAVIKSLSDEDREALKHLSSDTLASIRVEHIPQAKPPWRR